MDRSIQYYEKTKNEKHIFLYCVAGRSSSTAFQRIINSSNEVWLWGEPRNLVDGIIDTVLEMKRLHESDYVKRALTFVERSVEENKHTLFYANAIGNLDYTIPLLNSSISSLLRPKNRKIKRYGFKDIRTSKIQCLEYLKNSYKKSSFVFCFRNPLDQWPSVNKLQWFKYKDIDSFLFEYVRVASIYLEFAEKYNLNAFVENTDLRDLKKVKRIIKYLKIKKIDTDLIDYTVNTANTDYISMEDHQKIMTSPAYACYKRMGELSDIFFKS